MLSRKFSFQEECSFISATSETRPRSRTAPSSCSLLLKWRKSVTSLTPACRAICRVVAPWIPSSEKVRAAASRIRSLVNSGEEGTIRLRLDSAAGSCMQVLTCNLRSMQADTCTCSRPLFSRSHHGEHTVPEGRLKNRLALQLQRRLLDFSQFPSRFSEILTGEDGR